MKPKHPTAPEMGGPATWSSQRVGALWLAWFGLLGCLLVLNVWRQWRDRAPPAVSEALDSAAVATGENKPLQVLPEQHTDFVYSVVVDDVAMLNWIFVLVGPPGILTAVWLYTRHRRRPGPPT